MSLHLEQPLPLGRCSPDFPGEFNLQETPAASPVAVEEKHTTATTERSLSTFERVFSTHAPILESLLLQSPTDSIFQLYHTSHYLRTFLRSYPTAWQYLSFRLL